VPLGAPTMLTMSSASTRHTAPRRHAAPLLRAELKGDAGDITGEAERQERLRQLLGNDFKEDKLAPAQPPPPPVAIFEEDELAGRRVRKQQTSSDIEQLLDISDRFDGLRTLVEGVRKGSLGSAIATGRLCVARRDLPSKYIVCDQAYEVREIYYQGTTESGAEVVRVPVPSLDTKPPEGCEGYVLYMKVFSQEYHTEPVIVRPEEVGLVSLGEEVVDSLKIAIPILGFWLTVIAFLLAYGSATS
jgi:hypothetical protein